VTEEVARMYGYRKITPPTAARRSWDGSTRSRSSAGASAAPFAGSARTRLGPARSSTRPTTTGSPAAVSWCVWPIRWWQRSPLCGRACSAACSAPSVTTAGTARSWLRLFEVGDVFLPALGLVDDSGGSAGDGNGTSGLPGERERVALVLAREGDDAAQL